MARLAVQLDERRLDLRVPAVLRAAVLAEPVHHEVREPAGDREQLVVAQLARGGERTLDQVAEVVQLVPAGQVRPRRDRRVGALVERRQVPVVGLGALDEGHGLLVEGAHCCVFGHRVFRHRVVGRRVAGQLVRGRLQRLVDVGVHEGVAAAERLAGLLGDTAEVVEDAGGPYLLDDVGQRRGGVALLPPAQQTVGERYPGRALLRPCPGVVPHHPRPWFLDQRYVMRDILLIDDGGVDGVNVNDAFRPLLAILSLYTPADPHCLRYPQAPLTTGFASRVIYY